MTKVIQIIKPALQKIRVTDSNATPDPNEVADAIACMNRMVMRWQANGTQLGYSPVSTPEETIPIPIEAEQAVIYNLALDLSSEYGVAPSQVVVNRAVEHLRELNRDQFVSTPLRSFGSGAPLPGSSWASGYDVWTDGGY
jgi:hypothetical protein